MSEIWTGPYVDIAGIDTTIMVAADALGTTTTFDVPEKGIIETLRLTDLDNEDAAIDFLLFNAAITSGSNGVAYDMADGDNGAYIGQVKVSNADYSSLVDNSVAAVPNVGLAYSCLGGVITVQAVIRVAATYAAAGDISVSFVIWIPG